MSEERSGDAKRYEQELERAAAIIQANTHVGQYKAIGLLEVAAGVQLMADENAALRAQLAEQAKRLAAAEAVLHEIVCTEPPDDGVVLLSNDSPCHWDAEHKIDVYDHEHFSPLGDALMKLYRVLNGEGCEQLEMLLNAASGVCKSYPQRAIMRPYVKQLRKWFNDNPGWLPEPKKGA